MEPTFVADDFGINSLFVNGIATSDQVATNSAPVAPANTSPNILAAILPLIVVGLIAWIFLKK